MNSLANSVTRLKWSAVVFAVLWIGWMIWWSGDYDRVNVVMLTICGAIAGYLWYRFMRWHFQRKGLAPRDVHPPGSAAK
jgi:hypothetical protein